MGTEAEVSPPFPASDQSVALSQGVKKCAHGAVFRLRHQGGLQTHERSDSIAKMPGLGTGLYSLVRLVWEALARRWLARPVQAMLDTLESLSPEARQNMALYG